MPTLQDLPAEPGPQRPVWTLREPVPGYAPDDPASGAPYAEVLIDGITLADPRPYTYAVPERWRGRLLPGMAVLVPFGPRRGVAGYVTGLSFEPPDDHEAKEIDEVVSGEVIPQALQALLLWVASETLAPLSAVLSTAMPRGTLSRLQRTVHLDITRAAFTDLAASFSGPSAVVARTLLAHDGCAPLAVLSTCVKRSGAVLAGWRARGIIRYAASFVAPERREKRQLHALVTPGACEALTERQAQVLALLQREGGCLPVAELARAAGVTTSVINALAKRGAVALESLPVRRSANGGAGGERPHALTPAQAAVLAELERGLEAGTHYLLHGVTGSGKTEVYLRAIARVLDAGQSAIVLVPEISLTPQTVRRFQARFGDTVAVLHSHLSEGERYDEWQRVREGAARVVVGARSAVFAPAVKLGLIVIDEEHEGSYKQDKAPRYHARAVAEERCRLEGAALILGSATPSVETYARAVEGRLTLLEMPDRVGGRPMPPVSIVDMRNELSDGNRTLFSRHLQSALASALSRGEQAILLLNRRGYSSFVFCRECGYSCRCERCAVAMTFHQNPERLRCHYCDATMPVPEACPQCRSHKIKHFGAGTQQIEEATVKAFPEARVVRLDRDTTGRKGAHQVVLDAFGRGEYDILIGTQMVAKGLDFPRVTVVGVMAADGALHLPDFRASEHTFQLLTQVAGRAGRGDLASQVVVQTYSPEHPAILAARDHDFATFFERELAERRDAEYPPFKHLANLVLSGPDLHATLRCAELVAERLREHGGIEVLGPAAAPLAMLRGMHRFQVLIKAPELAVARELLRQTVPACQRPGVRVAVDLDPHSML